MPEHRPEEDSASAVAPIVRDPAILGGRPVFRGTRVPVEVLFDNLADGLGLDEIPASYPTIERGDALAVLEMARHRLLDAA
ncbi:DUF433 domain-containing protein [Benzoatithermus flavus]|uniref:DUF433 domain-containing protein n=1 Tax=Benzoatithermus flavus TaxID=3108223 RepID=A0ABU8XR73_9PROT